MEILFGAILLALVAAFVLPPLLRDESTHSPGEDPVLADLEARKEAKYREIRDAELDRAAGKLSEQDFRAQDAHLRTEALEILDAIERARPGAGHPPGGEGKGPAGGEGSPPERSP